MQENQKNPNFNEIPIRKRRYKARTAILLMVSVLVLTLGIFIIANVSRQEESSSINILGENGQPLKENVVIESPTYQDDDMLVVFNDKETKESILEFYLKSHPSANYVNRVGTGKQVVMYYDINSTYGLSQALGEPEFIDSRTGKKVEREWKYVYGINEQYEEPIYSCEDKLDKNGSYYEDCYVSGTETKQKRIWIDYPTKDIQEGMTTIGIEVDVQEGEWLDGVWDIAGLKIDEHAEWTNDLNTDLSAYWNFDEGAGTDIGQVVSLADGGSGNNMTVGGAKWGTGILQSSYLVEGAYTQEIFNPYGNDSVSLNVWINGTAVPNEYVLGNGNYEGGLILVGGGSSSIDVYFDDSGKQSVGTTANELQMLTVTFNTTHLYVYLNGTLRNTHAFADLPVIPNIYWNISAPGADANVHIYTDELGIWTRVLTSSEVTQLWNEGNGITYSAEPGNVSLLKVTLISPTNNSYTSDNNISFNANYSYEDMDISNATFYIYNSSGIFNKTTVTVTAAKNSTEQNITGFIQGNYKWNVYACGINATDTICDWGGSGNYTFDQRPFVIKNQTYNNTVYETAYEKFELNITTISSILSVNARLIYDGTSHTATSSCSGGNCTIISKIDIPLTNNRYSGNKTFYFNLTFYDGTTSYNFDTLSDLGSQNVSRIRLEICNATYTTKAMNFTVFDEQNLTRVKNYEIKSTFETWLGMGSVKRNQSFDEYPQNETTFCLSPNKTHYLDGVVEYDTYKTNSTAYVQRNYYFQNDSISNSIQKFKLHLLKAESSTSFIQEVQDQILSAVENALVYTYRYYPGEGVYKIVQISKTDGNGESIGFYEAEITDYKHIIKRYGKTLLETDAQKVVGKSVPYTLTFTVGESSLPPWSPWKETPTLHTELTYNDTSMLVTYSYVDDTSTITGGRLVIRKESASNNTVTFICNISSTFPSATLTCNMTDYSGTFIAEGKVDTQETVVEILQFIITTAIDILGKTGIIIGFFIILVAGMAFIWNPVAGVVGINAAMWFVSMMGFVIIPPVALFAILGVSILAIILLKT